MSKENNKFNYKGLLIILLFLLGASFIFLGSALNKNDNGYKSYEKYIENTEERLEQFLIEVNGIKKVNVIISTDYKNDGEFTEFYIKGVVIACTNGNDDKTKAEITDIASKYLGIGANKVKIAGIKQ